LIQKSVEQLGFRFSDIKILLISHAHNDHCAGAALVKKLTGAQYFVMDADVPVVESGGKQDFHYGADSVMWFPPVKVDRVLHDGDTVKLGDAVLTAHLTAGHTRGTTTWTLDETEAGRTLHVVIIGSPNVNPALSWWTTRSIHKLPRIIIMVFRCSRVCLATYFSVRTAATME